MKFLNKIGITVALLAISFTAVGQGAKSIERGDVLINPSITLGAYNYDYSWDVVNIIPPVALNFEYAYSDYLSFGIEAEYGFRRYQDNLFTASDYFYKYEFKTIGLRGSFHYLDFLKQMLDDKLGPLNSDKIDFYIGASSGLFWINTTEKWGQTGTNAQHERKSFSSNWRFGYFAGFRYFFSNNFGAFLETGKNPMGWAKVGLTLKF